MQKPFGSRSNENSPFTADPRARMEFDETQQRKSTLFGFVVSAEKAGLPIAATIREIVQKVSGVSYDNITLNKLRNIESEPGYQELTTEQKFILRLLSIDLSLAHEVEKAVSEQNEQTQEIVKG